MILGEINASYATGTVSGGSCVGGLVGSELGVYVIAVNLDDKDDKQEEREKSCTTKPPENERTRVEILHSYWDVETSGYEIGAEDNLIPGVEGKTTAELKGPTGYTGIYSNWNIDADNTDRDGVAVTGRDDPWDFGTAEQYPVLKTDFDGDGRSELAGVRPTTGRAADSNPGTAYGYDHPTADSNPDSGPADRYGHPCADFNPDPGLADRHGHTCADSNPDPGAVDRYGHTCADSNPDPGAVDRYGHTNADSNPDSGPADRHGQTGADFNSNSGPADRHGNPSAAAFTASLYSCHPICHGHGSTDTDTTS